MYKKIFFILFFIFVLWGYIFKLDATVSNLLFINTFKIKQTYNNFYEKILNYVNTYFNQQEHILLLEQKIKNNENYKLLYQENNKKLLELTDYNITKTTNLVKVISYVSLSDFSKVIVDLNVSIKNRILPLITNNNYSAGIILEKNNQLISYLNTNKKSNYAVFIGNIKAPGITSGIDKNGKLIIKYIPKWQNVKVGDEIITSGMDKIFPLGIKVGKVISINELANTKTIKCKPYAKVLNKKYFYTIY